MTDVRSTRPRSLAICGGNRSTVAGGRPAGGLPKARRRSLTGQLRICWRETQNILRATPSMLENRCQDERTRTDEIGIVSRIWNILRIPHRVQVEIHAMFQRRFALKIKGLLSFRCELGNPMLRINVFHHLPPPPPPPPRARSGEAAS